MNRKGIVTLHLAMAALFFPFLLVMPISGGLHVLGIDGVETTAVEFTITDPVPEAKDQWETFFREQFKKAGVDYDFEYIRGGGTSDYVFRPTTIDYFKGSKTEAGLEMSRVKPSGLKSMLELHKGHGPRIMKYIEAAFSLCLLIAAFTGVYLGLTSRLYRPVMIGSMVVGFLIMFFAMM